MELSHRGSPFLLGTSLSSVITFGFVPPILPIIQWITTLTPSALVKLSCPNSLSQSLPNLILSAPVTQGQSGRWRHRNHWELQRKVGCQPLHTEAEPAPWAVLYAHHCLRGTALQNCPLIPTPSRSSLGPGCVHCFPHSPLWMSFLTSLLVYFLDSPFTWILLGSVLGFLLKLNLFSQHHLLYSHGFHSHLYSYEPWTFLSSLFLELCQLLCQLEHSSLIAPLSPWPWAQQNQAHPQALTPASEGDITISPVTLRSTLTPSHFLNTVSNQSLSILVNNQIMSELPRELQIILSLPAPSRVGPEGPPVTLSHLRSILTPSSPLGARQLCCSADAHPMWPLQEPLAGFLPPVSSHGYLLFFKNIYNPVIPLIKNMQRLPIT